MKQVRQYWVYVIQGQSYGLVNKRRPKAGPYYVGMTTSPSRRLREHNGDLVGGAKSTKKARPWAARALYGPYEGRSEALKAEYKLKRQKRGVNRTKWLVEDSPLCRGLGSDHPWVTNNSWSPDL